MAKPLPLVKDWDLVALAQYMIRARGRDMVRVTKVKVHATDSDVELGRVWLEDKLGNAEAHTAADLGRRHQSELLMHARRCCSCIGSRLPFLGWLLIMMGKGFLPLTHLSARKKVGRMDMRVFRDLAALPGPPGFLDGPGLVLMLRSGHAVLASCASLLPFLVLCIGLLML